MVRFIIFCFHDSRRLVALIYIPIWLDLLFVLKTMEGTASLNLHSNMVRFIILFDISMWFIILKFTFQYG